MADKFLQLDNSKYVIQSSEIKVFPSSYRGTNDNTFINLESKLSTEYSLRHLSPSFTKNSYILSWESNKLCCIIAGYYFEINVSKTNDIPTGYTKVAIKLNEVPLATGSTTDTTMILTSWKETTNSNDQSTVVDKQLDFKDDTQNEYYFSGLVFVNTIPSGCFGLDLSDNTSIQNTRLVIDSSQVESKAQNVEIAGSLYNGTATGAVRGGNESNTTASSDYSFSFGDNTSASGISAHAEGKDTSASGSYSHAEGLGTIANHKSQRVFGEYNIEDTNVAVASGRGDYVEIVGNGTSSTPNNARTLDWDGNETLYGKITAKGAKITDTTEIVGNTSINTTVAALGKTTEIGTVLNTTSIAGATINLNNTSSITTSPSATVNIGYNNANGTTNIKSKTINIESGYGTNTCLKINTSTGKTDIGNTSYATNITASTTSLVGNVKIDNDGNKNVTIGKDASNISNWVRIYGGATSTDPDADTDGGIEINHGLSCTGDTYIGNENGALSLTGKTISMQGNSGISVWSSQGDITIGIGSPLTKRIKILQGNVEPLTHNSTNLGSTTAPFRYIYANRVYAGFTGYLTGDISGNAETVTIQEGSITDNNPYNIVLSDTMPSTMDANKLYLIY